LLHVDPFLGNPETRARNNRKYIARRVFNVVRTIPIARQQFAKHISAEANAQNNMTTIARQRHEKQALPTVKDVFSLDPPRDYIGGREPNQIRLKRMRTEKPVWRRGRIPPP
jgi:hypothetical protein